ncbi:hypothetical protein BDC45DRAFT_582018 [Circinella umbellata]|nr:hypothetical protein BDC45DRAFT_582018 [Circinella umbellata]
MFKSGNWKLPSIDPEILKILDNIILSVANLVGSEEEEDPKWILLFNIGVNLIVATMILELSVENGLRAQFVSDMNDMIICTSKSDFCSDSSDGSIFLNMKLYNKINTKDTIALHSGYTLFVKDPHENQRTGTEPEPNREKSTQFYGRNRLELTRFYMERTENRHYNLVNS